jgi:hypothetical protein
VIGRYRAALELTLAAVALLGCALSWSNTRSTRAVGPIADGQPTTMSVVFDPQWVMLTFLLATVAGVLAVVGTARLRRRRPTAKGPVAGPEQTLPAL